MRARIGRLVFRNEAELLGPLCKPKPLFCHLKQLYRAPGRLHVRSQPLAICGPPSAFVGAQHRRTIVGIRFGVGRLACSRAG